MSRVLDELPSFKSGPASVYPWDEWTDGRVWEITRGEDYTIVTTSMMAALRVYGARHGYNTETRNLGDRVAFRFTREGK